MKINLGYSWNAMMRKAEKLAIWFAVPPLLWPKWTCYQTRRFIDVYWPKFCGERKRKTIFRCICEMAILLAKWRCIPFHYFRHVLYSRHVSYENVLQYIPETVFYYRILPRWRLDSYQLDDKIVFAAIASSAGLPLPKTIFIIRNERIITDCGIIVADETQLYNVLAEITTEKVYFKPAMCGSGGQGILVFRRLKKHFYYGTNKLTLSLLHELAGADWIVQEEVEQTHQLERIFPGSINTFKITTILRNKSPQLIRCVVRFGRSECEVDNLHAGGLLVNVDISSGQLSTRAIDVELTEYFEHPETGAIFGNEKFAIDPILDLACSAAMTFPLISVAGWDIALSDKGPVLIEGNSSPDIGSVQRFGGVANYFK